VLELTRFVGSEYDRAVMLERSPGDGSRASEPPASTTESSARRRDVPCPTCRRPHPWSGNPHRPFCSLTCRLVDLGFWLDEGYRIPEVERPHDG